MISLPLKFSLPLGLLRISVTAAALLAGTAAASAQAAPNEPSGFLDGLFGVGEPAAPGHGDRLAQASSGDLIMRIDRLEAQIRQMTGVIEQLQFRNQQMTDQLRRMQEDSEYRFQELGAKGAAAQPPSGQPARPTGAPTIPRPSATPQPGRRGDSFDPTQDPTAPGAPRTLGALPGGGAPAAPGQPPDVVVAEEQPIGAPGGRSAGEPLNLSTMSRNVGPDPGFTPPSEGRNGNQMATLPPSDSPRDYYDLAYGYVLRKDYALAEDGFRTFLRKYPSDRMAPEAQYWLGESLFQRQRYRDAAEAFLNVSTKYESTAKAPDALLRLGQSLAVLGEKEAACASLGEVLRKYPRAALGVKQGVDREQKRVGC
jgi:tol-pal system protein YbgF